MPFKVTAVRLLRSPLDGSSRRRRCTRIFSSSSAHHLLEPSLRLKPAAGSVMKGGITKKAIIPMITQMSPSRRNLTCQSQWRHSMCEREVHLQPLPASPVVDSSHLQNSSSQQSAVDLSNGSDCVENTDSNGQLVCLVEVGQVQNLDPTVSLLLHFGIEDVDGNILTISGINPPWATPIRARSSQKLSNDSACQPEPCKDHPR